MHSVEITYSSKVRIYYESVLTALAVFFDRVYLPIRMSSVRKRAESGQTGA